jgi:hypothetical protein
MNAAVKIGQALWSPAWRACRSLESNLEALQLEAWSDEKYQPDPAGKGTPH